MVKLTAIPIGALLLGTALFAEVKVTDGVTDEGQACFKVETASATYFFQKRAAGFSSIVDKNGKDWVGYHSGGGSGGEYRGIPNIGGCCHPGYPTSSEGVAMTSTLTDNKADKATIVSVSGDGKWRTKWDFYDTRATLTVEKAGAKYWVLYEGTPGGAWSSAEDFLLFSDGTKKLGSQANFSKDLAAPEWVYFGDGPSKLGLLFVHHSDDNIVDQFWSFGDMTVFGFGRTCKGECLGLTATNNVFSIAITNRAEYSDVKQFAASIAGGASTALLEPHRAIESRNDGVSYGGDLRMYDFTGRAITGAPASLWKCPAHAGVYIISSGSRTETAGIRVAMLPNHAR